MRAGADEMSTLLKVLSHPARMLLLCLLTERERTVGELEQQLDMRQSALSQQLALLRREGIVAARRDGQRVHYRIARDDVAELLGFLYERYCREQPGEGRRR
jgi:ArsR family transcriptional regulator, virulence genes transcriptional regulator